MWRIINGIPRAIRAHFHGTRAATGVCVDEENTDLESESFSVEADDSVSVCNFNRSNFSCGFNNWQSADHDKQDWWNRQSCRNDFWSIFHGQHNTLEAVTWGAAVVLGIQLSRPRWRDRYLYNGSEHRRNSFLYQVAFALPGSITTKKSIKSEARIFNQSDEELNNDESSNLEMVMKEFTQTCTKYTALSKSIVGLKHIEAGNMASAVKNLTEASNLGNISSQFNLGLCYETGEGVEKDLQKARECYEMAGDADHPEALYNLALLQTDFTKMIQLLEKAAELGLSQAQTYLGVYYSESGDAEDMKKAVSYFRQAADQNDAEAQCFLGMCYERGLGVEMNECKAGDLYYKAAQANHDGALYNLAVFQEHGLGGLPVDRVSAIELYEQAAKAGNEHAQFRLEEMKARSAVNEWKVQYGEDGYQGLKSVLTDYNLSPSASSPSISEYVQQHLRRLTFSENLFANNSPEEEEQTPRKRKKRRARFSIGEDDLEEQDYMSERNNGLLRLSSLSPNCSIMGMSRNSTMPELGYIPCT